ncbi:retrovirus-related pol polyprotein from transposon TNT 1-94 [Tanacetum coccineum]
MLAPKGSTFNGRPTFANPMYLMKAQTEKPCLYEIPYDTSNPANRFVPDREETLTLEKESRSKLNKDKVQPYDYTKQNSLYEISKPASQEYHDQLAHANEVRKKMWRKYFVKSKPKTFNNIGFLPTSKSIRKSRQAYNVMTNNINHFRELVDQAWEKHSHDSFRAPNALDMEIVQLILFIVDSGCTKNMTGNLKLLCNFVEKYLGTVRFGNDQFAPILRYGDLVQGNITIKRVYYIEGLNHNLFSIEKASSTLICFMAKASPTQAWLWHRRLSHLNFDYINLLTKKDIVIGLPKLKYVKDQLCSSCELSKAKRSLFKTKVVPSLKGRLNLLHMDLCSPMRVESINGKKYILNGVVERQNRTLVQAARTMLSASKLPLFFWDEAIATACYTQNRSIIIPSHENTAYHIINDRKPLIRHLHIFGCTCYLTRDGENLDKMKEKGDPCILVGYSTHSKGYRVYNKITRLIVESIHIKFDEIKEMTKTSVDNNTSGLVPQRQKASDYDNSGPAPQLQNVSPSADTTTPSQQELDLLFGPLYDEFFTTGNSSVNKSSSPTDNYTQQDTLPKVNIHPSTEPITPTTNVYAKENNANQAADT